MPITITVIAGYKGEFKFNLQKDNCSVNDLALALTSLEMAKVAVIGELAKEVKTERKEE